MGFERLFLIWVAGAGQDISGIHAWFTCHSGAEALELRLYLARLRRHRVEENWDEVTV